MKNIHILINLTTVLVDSKDFVSFQNLLNKGGITKAPVLWKKDKVKIFWAGINLLYQRLLV